MRAEPSVPTFAVVGQPNEGKTSIISTLTEDDRAPVGPKPGTTRHLARYPVLVDGVEIMVFYDTPGFESPGEVLDWLQKHKDEPNPAAAFLKIHKHRDLYPEECQILQPLAEGCAVIYVVDGGRPLREVDKMEAEILRLCGVARIGIINCKGYQKDQIEAWKKQMRKDFNVVREFNACSAVFADRIELLKAAKAIVSDWECRIQETIDSLEAEWEDRLLASADAMVKVFKEVLNLCAREPFGDGISKESAGTKANDAVKQKIRALENQFRKQIRKRFLHSNDHWEINPHLEMDIFEKEVWRMLGLSKTNLMIAGTVAGASTGMFFDVAVAGHALGLGTAIGGGVGLVGTWLLADHAVSWRTPEVSFLGLFKLGGEPLGGTKVEARIEPRSKLPGILFDRMLLFIEAAASWAHGRRPEKISPCPSASGATESTPVGRINGLKKEQREAFIAFIELLYRQATGREVPQSDVDKAIQNVRELILDHLRRFTTERKTAEF